MANSEPDKVVVDAADAVTSSRDVPWERYAKLVTPAGRGALENLRALSRAFAEGPSPGQASAGPAPAVLFAGRFVRRFLGAVVVVAAVEVAAMSLLLPWTWADYHREHGDVAVYLTTLFAGHVATACLLLLAGRRDRRTRLLAAYFLLKAPMAGLHMVAASSWEIPADVIEGFLLDPPAPARLLAYLCLPPFLFAPAFVWAFARECPRVGRRTRLDNVLRRMVPVSVAIGCAMAVAGMAAGELGEAGLGPVVAFSTMIAANLWALAAVVVVARRARSAPAHETRRVRLFSVAFVVYLGSTLTYDVSNAVPAGFWLANYEWTPLALLIAMPRFPGLLLLWYAVLAARVPHLREVVRAFYRRLLVRRGLLGAAAAAPAVGLGWLVASRPERTVGAAVTDPLAQSCSRRPASCCWWSSCAGGC